MLDQLQMNLRHYERIAQNAGSEMSQSQADQLSDWLKRRVGRLIASLLTRPGFRRRVRWPIERLTGELDCPERAAVLAVDEALVSFASALRAVAQTDAISQQLLRLGPHLGKVEEGDPLALDAVPENQSIQRTPLGFGAVDFVAGRPWRDLASAEDYFGPRSQLNFKEAQGKPFGNFSPFVNKRLRAPGDFISRCLDIRVDHWHGVLQRFYSRCQRARQIAKADLGTQWTELNDLRRELNRRIDELRRLSRLVPEAQVRDSCIALLQIQVGFHPETDLSWLGPVAGMAASAYGIPHQVSKMRQWDVPERAAEALLDIDGIVRDQRPEDVIEEMKATKRLVLVEAQREAFIDGVPIGADNQAANWHGHDGLLWELLWTLADRARERKSVDCYCLTNRKARDAQDPPSSQAVKDRRSDLKKLIVPELNKLIVDAGPGTYRLALDPDDICLLGWLSEEKLDVLPHIVPRLSHL